MVTGADFGGWRATHTQELRERWGWFFALGICLIVLGVVALAYAAAATVVSMMAIGWLLMIGGVLQIVHAFWRDTWGGLFIDLFTGVLYLAAGFILVANPIVAAAGLTLLIAAFLWIGGVFRIAAAVTVRHHNWGWLLLSGIVNVLLGFLIWSQWPLSGLWVIGLFVGIDMIFNGWSLAMLGLLLHGPDRRAYA